MDLISIADQVAAWLRTLPSCQEHPVVPIIVTIGGKQYGGARYQDKHHGNAERFYLVGGRPITKRKTCYVLDGATQEWFVGCYADANATSTHAFAHPFGPNFILMPWTCGEPIDYYERYKYDRKPISVVNQEQEDLTFVVED